MPDPEAELSAVVDGFLGHTSVERGLARNTVEAYAREVRGRVFPGPEHGYSATEAAVAAARAELQARRNG